MSGEILQHGRSMADFRGVACRLSLRSASPGVRGPVGTRRRTLSPLEPLPAIERCEDKGVSLVKLARLAEEAAAQ